MNIRDKHFPLPDIQAQADRRDIRIDAVGIKDVRHPLSIRSGGKEQATIATLSMTVGLPAPAKASDFPMTH
jgi:GTP cyclohydrolase I